MKIINKLIKIMLLTVAVASLLAMMAPGTAFAGNDFVCPVLNDTVGDHNPNAVPISGGHYTVAPAGASHLSVPDHATNGDGAGSPGGAHAAPGDTDYTAIWNGD